MELDHALVADIAAPRPDGKLDLYGVGWDTIFSAAVPASHPRMDVIIRFLASAHEMETDHRVVVSLMGADGHQLERIDAHISAMSHEQRSTIEPGHRVGIGLHLTLASVVFPAYGAYNIVITWDGNEARQPIRLFVKPIPAPA
jgi:hypothetical protein